MNIDEIIDTVHTANRRKWTSTAAGPRQWWHIAVPAAAAAAVLLLIVWPRGSEVPTTNATAGFYCNSQCNPDDVMALIDNNINHIKEIQAS